MIERDHYLQREAEEAPTARDGPATQEGTMLTRSKHWLAAATLWLIGAAVLLGTNGFRWT